MTLVRFVGAIGILVLAANCASPPDERAAATPSEASEPLCPPADRSDQISWERAVDLIESGRINYAAQYHDLRVCLRDTRGGMYSTVEPKIDEVMRTVREAPNWPFPIATE